MAKHMLPATEPKKLKGTYEGEVKLPPEKPFWMSKSVWLNTLTAIVAILSMLPTQINLSEQTIQIILLFVAVLNIIIRVISGQPVTLSGLTKK